ncbi:MAG: transglutaminase family protein [Methylobacteriaceae bacterium]|nr:transglutaminase family protein [Methylobacteriaceae bacterium]
MTSLSATLRRLYLDPADYVDSDHADVQRYATSILAAEDEPRAIARALYRAVRDDIRYDPYVDYHDPETFRASSVLAARRGYCVGKASLYAALCRIAGIPARLGFADVKNHLATPKLIETMGTDLFAWHGYSEVYLHGEWLKATPTFNASLCEKLGVEPLDFDGRSDALLHPFDAGGRTFMAYVETHGTFHDVPVKFLVREMARLYPGMTRDRLAGRDMEREASAA